MVRYVARYADPELYELVSHLRSELSEQNKEMRALQVKNKMLKDESAFEIERLRERIKEAAKLNLELMEIRRTNEVEIERLQQDVKYYRELLKAAKVPEWVTIDQYRDRIYTND